MIEKDLTNEIINKNEKQYICPELSVITLSLTDVLYGSVEDLSSYVEPDPGDWGDDDPGFYNDMWSM